MAEKLEYDSYYGVLNLGSNALAEAIYVKMECEDVDAALATAAHRYNAFPALLEALKGAQAFVSRDCQDLIESCSWGPYLELFGRGVREGWTVWGNQAEADYKPDWKTYSYNSSVAAE